MEDLLWSSDILYNIINFLLEVSDICPNKDEKNTVTSLKNPNKLKCKSDSKSSFDEKVDSKRETRILWRYSVHLVKRKSYRFL